MTAEIAGAPSSDAQRWQAIDWPDIEKRVYRLQVRIAKSIREQRWGKARALQHLLSRSFAAKVLAVKRVISNKGSRTAGVDGVLWKSPGQYWRAAQKLRTAGYHAQPLRRIYNSEEERQTPSSRNTHPSRPSDAGALCAGA